MTLALDSPSKGHGALVLTSANRVECRWADGVVLYRFWFRTTNGSHNEIAGCMKRVTMCCTQFVRVTWLCLLDKIIAREKKTSFLNGLRRIFPGAETEHMLILSRGKVQLHV